MKPFSMEDYALQLQREAFALTMSRVVPQAENPAVAKALGHKVPNYSETVFCQLKQGQPTSTSH